MTGSRTVTSQFAWIAHRMPERTALVDAANTVTYDQLWRRSNGLAAHLAQLPPKGRIGIYLPNRIEWVETFLAANLAGVSVVPINHRYRRGEVEHLVIDGSIDLIVIDEDEQRRETAASIGVDTLVVGREYERALAQGSAAARHVNGESCVLYTSGTTAAPKGVRLTQANQIFGMFLGPSSVLGISESDVVLIATPLAHRVGQVRLMCGVLGGARTILATDGKPSTLLAAIQDHDVTLTGMVPTMARDLLFGGDKCKLAEALRSVRAISLTGEVTTGSLRAALAAALPHIDFWTFFASTETGLVTALPPRQFIERPASSGRPVPGIEVGLFQDDGSIVSEGQGEILVRSGPPGSYAVGAGYCGWAEAEDFVDAAGWFHTGDIGRIDADGWLAVTGRAKDMVLSGGLNIATREVEEAVLSLLGVSDVAVTGEPDDRFGERVVAWVVTRDATLTADDVRAHVASRLASYKKPRTVRFVDSLPRTASGKVAKWMLPSTEGTPDQNRAADEVEPWGS